jgi:hypothetical protein
MDCRRKADVPRGTEPLGVADACRTGCAKPNFMNLPTNTARGSCSVNQATMVQVMVMHG